MTSNDQRLDEISPVSVVLSRIFLVYVVLYAGQWLVGFLPGIGVLSFYWVSAGTEIAHWTLQHVIGLPAHSPPLPSWYIDHRPDDLVELTRCVLLAGLAILVAAAWTIRKRNRSAWERSPSWPYVIARFGLAGIMFSYAWGKLLPEQFNGGRIPLPLLLWRLGDFTPQHLLWTLMGYSRPYAIFAGAGEMLGSIFLCFRRTTTAGALVLIAVLANVVAMNFAYDVPVKIDAVNFLLIAIFIAAPEARRIARAIFESSPQRARLLPYLERIRANGLSHVAVGLLTLWLLVNPLRSIANNSGGLHLFRAPLPPHAGIFELRQDPMSASRDTGNQPWSHWRRVAVTSRGLTALTGDDSLRRYALTTDTAAKRMRLVPASGADAMEFVYSHSDSTLTLRSAVNDSVTLRRIQPTLLRWKHIWAW